MGGDVLYLLSIFDNIETDKIKCCISIYLIKFNRLTISVLVYGQVKLTETKVVSKRRNTKDKRYNGKKVKRAKRQTIVDQATYRRL